MHALQTMEVFYTPEDIWRIQEELKGIKSVQAKHGRQLHNHSERLLQVERRGDESKIQNLWTSYFPSVHAPPTFSQPQAFPPAEPTIGPFNGFDGQQPQNLVTGLVLDEVDVPRRGASRANSVRFDESAIQNHWAPESHSSGEYLPARSNSGIGGPLMERSLSYKSDYKSDGRQSSMRSFDNFSMAGSEHDCTLPSALRPRDIIECNTPSAYDSAPTVIRCWLGMDCSYDSILFAMICTGSSRSWIDSSLVARCGFKDKIWTENGEERISLSLFLGSASVPTESISSHTTLPRLKVEFTVLQSPERPHNQKLVQIVLGSDILSAIKADVLFSKRQLTFQVRDGQKVYVDFELDAHSFDIFDTTPHGAQVHAGNMLHKTDQAHTVNEQPLDIGNGHENGDLVEHESVSRDNHMHTGAEQEITLAPSSMNDQKPTLQTVLPTPRKDSIAPVASPHDDLQGVLHPSSSNADLPSALDTATIRRSVERTKSTGEGIIKGPYAAAASKALSSTSGSTWDTWRKSDAIPTSVASIAAAAGNASNSPKGAGSGGEQIQRRASRSMKILRTSTSKTSATTTPATPNPNQMTFASSMVDENTKTLSPMNGFSLNTATKAARSSSLETPRPTGHTKSRSSTNVVGGATAFKWMSGPRPGNGGGSGGGSGAE